MLGVLRVPPVELGQFSAEGASRRLNKMLVECAARSLNSQFVKAPRGGTYSVCNNRGASAKSQRRDNTVLLNLQGIFATARPNRSLNRTLHSVPGFVQAKTLAQIPSRCSGTVSFDVRPHILKAVSRRSPEIKSIGAALPVRRCRPPKFHASKACKSMQKQLQ